MQVNFEKLLDSIQRVGIHKTNIWCGAGISYDNPCGLPLGYGLSWMIFEDYMSYNENIIKIWQNKGHSVWEKSNKIISKYIKNTHEIVRPEIIISCITRCNNLNATKEFYNKFSELTNANYNLNHIYLAYFVYFGGTVFTTNFDTCIEKAYENKFHENMSMESLCNGKVIKYSGTHGGEIIHLHGIFGYGVKAGASIENVMQGYDKISQNIILDALINNLNLFVGYSFSDDYDLNSLFHTYYNKNMDIFICNHKDIRQQCDNKLPIKATEVFGKYICQNIIEYKTTNLLKTILYVLINNYEKFKVAEGETINWKAILKFPENADNEYKLIYFIELINQLQISYKVIEKDLAKKYAGINEHIRKELGDRYDLLQYNLLVNSSFIVKREKMLKNEQLKLALNNRLENNFFRLNAIVRKAERDKQLKIVSRFFRKYNFSRSAGDSQLTM